MTNAMEFPYTYKMKPGGAKVRTAPDAKSPEFAPALRMDDTAYVVRIVPSTGADGFFWAELASGGYFAAHLGTLVYTTKVTPVTTPPSVFDAGAAITLISHIRRDLDALEGMLK